MPYSSRKILLLAILFAVSTSASAQERIQSTRAESVAVPRVVRYSGVLQRSGDTPVSGTFGVTFAIYKEESGEAPLWLETQNVEVQEGRFTALIGSTSAEGIPAELFAAGEAQWLGVTVEGRPERRSLLVSVPYALKAGDAATLGGMPPSAFVQSAPSAANAGPARLSTSATSGAAAPGDVLAPVDGTGTTNHIAKFLTAASVGDSSVVEVGGNVGIGTTSPVYALHVEGNATRPAFYLAQNNTGGYGMFVKPGNDANYAFLLNNAANTINRHIFYGNGDAILANGGGRVGINTASPAYPLHVVGNTAEPTFYIAQNNPNGYGMFVKPGSDSNYAFLLNNAANSVNQHHFYGNGNAFLSMGGGAVGVGTLSPAAKLHVLESAANGAVLRAGNVSGTGSATFSAAVPPASAVRGDASATSLAVAGLLGTSVSPSGFGAYAQNLATSGVAVGVFGLSPQSADSTGLWGEAGADTVPAPSGDAVGIYGRSWSTSGTGVFGMAQAATGDAVGVFGRSNASGGTGVWGEVIATTGANWGVLGRVASADTNAAGGIFDYTGAGTGNVIVGRAGTTKVFRVDSTGRMFANGGTQTSGADFAESIEVNGAREMYAPGDVLVIDASGTRRVELATEPYSRLVAGIYSTKPGVLATPHGMDDPRLAKLEVPVAIVGIVPTKVSAENGAIRPGDLLVTSSIPGHAMKGTDTSRMLGAVVGKALQSFEKGTGVIEVLVTLQ